MGIDELTMMGFDLGSLGLGFIAPDNPITTLNKKLHENKLYNKVEKSKLVDWTVMESCAFYKKEELIHSCVVTGEDLIDVISTFEPTMNIYPIKQSE